MDEQPDQCGYCINGHMIRSAKELLDGNPPHATAARVRQGLAGNLCRCGTHGRIIRAVLKASQRPREECERAHFARDFGRRLGGHRRRLPTCFKAGRDNTRPPCRPPSMAPPARRLDSPSRDGPADATVCLCPASRAGRRASSLAGEVAAGGTRPCRWRAANDFGDTEKTPPRHHLRQPVDRERRVALRLAGGKAGILIDLPRQKRSGVEGFGLPSPTAYQRGDGAK